MRRAAAAVGAALVLAGCGRGRGGGGAGADPPVPFTMKVTSPAFAAGRPIPERYSCEGDNVSPPLAWSRVPAGTKELALVVDDPEAPGGTFTHWVLTGLGPARTGLAEGERPAGARQAMGSSDAATYIGPCPPDGTRHHYRFTLYALRSRLDLAPGALTGTARAAIARSAIAGGRLTATFAR